jgi:RNA polymerase sigma factor (sigma-70 family)
VISAFQRDAERFAPLNSEQQIAMVQHYQTLRLKIKTLEGSNSARNIKRREELSREASTTMEHVCSSCWGLCMLIVKEKATARYSRARAIEMITELMAEASIALMRAVQIFDPMKIPSFSTFAANVIRNHIMTVLASNTGAVRPPASWSRVNRIASKRIPVLTLQLGRAPSALELEKDLREIAERWAHSKLTAADRKLSATERNRIAQAKLVKSGMDGAISSIADVLLISRTMTSLDAPLSIDGGGRVSDNVSMDVIDETFDRAETDEIRQAVTRALTSLDKRDREILELRYGLKGGEVWTIAAIAKHYDITCERIRQIEKRALATLRDPKGQFPELAGFLGND